MQQRKINEQVKSCNAQDTAKQRTWDFPGWVFELLPVKDNVPPAIICPDYHQHSGANRQPSIAKDLGICSR